MFPLLILSLPIPHFLLLDFCVTCMHEYTPLSREYKNKIEQGETKCKNGVLVISGKLFIGFQAVTARISYFAGCLNHQSLSILLRSLEDHKELGLVGRGPRAHCQCLRKGCACGTVKEIVHG